MPEEIKKPWENGRLRVSANRRYLEHENGKPFFWLADTGWLLFERLMAEEAEVYLEDRRQKGFTVIQAMLVHKLPKTNLAGDLPFVDCDMARPNPAVWAHVDRVIRIAESKGVYMAPVCIWGSIVHDGDMGLEKAKTYGRFLGERYRDFPNIIWINGGDIDGSVHYDEWMALGETVKWHDPNHLMTFHAGGGLQSSLWFHTAPWLDFNMFQSGHGRYGQREETFRFAEDNWRYLTDDLTRNPPKPALDGEPSYEDIPQGLHDITEKHWKARDCRRYAWWSVFAGALGHTYGHNAVMQMYKPRFDPAYGSMRLWSDGMKDPGSNEMQWVRKLMESVPYYEGFPDNWMPMDSGEKHDRLAAFRGSDFAFVYIYHGRGVRVKTGEFRCATVTAGWYDPRTGSWTKAGDYPRDPVMRFDAPDGEDWVLTLNDSEKPYFTKGF
jgi:hypothetical protein